MLDEGADNQKDDFYKLMKKRAANYYSADKDGDSQLDFEEFCEMIANRDDADQFKPETLRLLFDKLDMDGSGKLDLSEYIQWALRESLQKAKGKVIDLFRAWDEVRELAPFCLPSVLYTHGHSNPKPSMLTAQRPRNGLDSERSVTLVCCCSRRSQDGSGFIDMKEFSTVLFALGFKCSIRDVKAVFDSLDADGGGEIEYKELNTMMRRGTTTSTLKEPPKAAGKKPTPPASAKGGGKPSPRKK